MNGRRVRARSDHAPTSIVARVAATADAATSVAMTVGSAVMVSYTNTLRYMFSTVQASWPTRPSTTTVTHVRPERARGVVARGGAGAGDSAGIGILADVPG